MIYTRNEALENQLLDEMWEEMKDNSRQHPSVTDLIYCLTAKYYNMQKGENAPKPSRKTQLYFSLGIGLEKVLLIKRQSDGERAGEFEGIFYHIDSLQGSDTELMEFKTTRQGPNKKFEDLTPTWFIQAKAYCKTQGTTKIEFAVIYVIQAEIQAFSVEFTQEEIDENWAWLQSRKDVWNEAVASNSWPEEYKYNQPWECKECIYALVCEARSAARKFNNPGGIKL